MSRDFFEFQERLRVMLQFQELKVHSMTLEEAREMCGWVYSDEYSVYNLDWDEGVKHGYAFTDENVLQEEYKSVYSGGELVAFFRLHKGKETVSIGIAIKPSLCGQGNGKLMMKLALADYHQRYDGIPLVLMVRSWNMRAIKCYRSCGFVETESCVMNTPSGKADFICMEYRQDRK